MVKAGIRNYAKLKAHLDKIQKGPKTVINRTLADAKKRVPGWISTEVSQVYGIKKKEVGDGPTSRIKATGDTMSDLRFEVTGRVLTPVHFGMTPKTPKAGGGAYTLKASIYKGQKKTLGKVQKNIQPNRADNFRRAGQRSSVKSPIMLMRTGTTYIPFQRQSTNRKNIVAIKTLSVPQMVSNEDVAKAIQTDIDVGLSKRFDHHMKRVVK